MRHALYTGFVIHNRVSPVKHKFSYKIRMFFLNIDEIQEAFKSIPFASVEKFNLLAFWRKNYLPCKDNKSIREAVETHLKDHGHTDMPHKIFILTHLSYFGYCYNPVSFYYCYDKNEQLTYLLAEVNNTPWNERHVYVQKIPTQNKPIVRLKKELHVSPFLPMDLEYKWVLNIPAETIKISMACIKEKPVFFACMKLAKKELSPMQVLLALLVNPFATQLVLIRIYWQALFLFIKRAPFYAHASRKV